MGKNGEGWFFIMISVLTLSMCGEPDILDGAIKRANSVECAKVTP